MAPTRRRSASRIAIAAALLVAALAPPATAATSPTPLSARLAELSRPALRTAPAALQAERLGLAPSGPGSLQRAGGAVLVNVRFEGGALDRLDDLRQAGAEVLAASRRYQEATAAVRPADLPALAAVPGVASVGESLAPILSAATTAAGGPGTCEGGEVISEGLAQLRVDDARQQFGLRGKGTTVGILSDSFDTATEAPDESGPIATHALRDIEGNDLPGPAGTCGGQQVATSVLSDHGGGSDEGRAMAQIVHDLAPHAGLAFATAFQSELSFAQNIEELARPVALGGAGAGVIADDVAYLEEPFFQDGPVAGAIGKVTAAGATYLTAAGNDNNFEGTNEIGSWEAPGFRDAPSCPTAVEAALEGDAGDCMDFDPGPGTDRAFAIDLAPKSGFILDLQWAEPWFGVEADLDAFLLDEGNDVIEEVRDDNIETQRPVELIQWENEGTTTEQVRLVIDRCAGSCNEAASPTAKPRLKFILNEEGAGISSIEFPESGGGDVVGPAVYGHAGSAAAITLGAVRYSNSAFAEPFSSRGPATHYFGPVTGTDPAAPLGIPEVLAKPDLAATDCGATTFFAQVFAGAWRFCGTSAAAPHAAAVAALIAQGAPGTGNEEVRDSLTATAVPVVSSGPEAVGAGLLDAAAALEAAGAVATAADPPSETVPPLTPLPPAVPPAVPQPPAPRPAPSTSLKRKPARVVRTARPPVRAVFRFGSNQAPVGFLCKVDRAPFRPCGAFFARLYAAGTHVVKAKARNAEGSLDPTPVVYRFRVLRSG